MKTIICLLLLLAVVNLIPCQEYEQMIVFTLQGILKNLETINGKLGDVQQKLGNHENIIQELHQELEHVKGVAEYNQGHLERLSQETVQCLRGDDFEHLTNVSAADIKYFVHKQMSGVIALAQKDVDECGEDKEDCVPNATCKNSIGSYSCSCNKPFKGDGISSCEFECISPAKVLTGLGCVKQVTKGLTYFQMNDNCQKDGWRFLQHMSQEQMDDVGHSFPTNQPWVGIYDGKWPSDESLVSEDLWMEGYLSDPSKPCGFITMDSPSNSYKLGERNCSELRWGYCQFPLPW